MGFKEWTILDAARKGEQVKKLMAWFGKDVRVRTSKTMIILASLWVTTAGMWMYNWGHHDGRKQTDQAWRQAIHDYAQSLQSQVDSIKVVIGQDTLPAVTNNKP